MAEQVSIEGPLQIDQVNYPDPVVTFSGSDWSLYMLCPWRLLRNGIVVVDPEKLTEVAEVAAEIVTDAIWELIGYALVGVRASSLNPNDPVFELSAGYTIEVTADTDMDPWVLELSKEAFVGTMTTPPD